jgi:hypothetical protein
MDNSGLRLAAADAISASFQSPPKTYATHPIKVDGCGV